MQTKDKYRKKGLTVGNETKKICWQSAARSKDIIAYTKREPNFA
jgi:hypothetical protein